MSDKPLRVLAVVGSLRACSATRVVVLEATEMLRQAHVEVDLVDLLRQPLSAYNPDTSKQDPGYRALQPRVAAADAFLLGSPDYHGSFSGALKDFLDHFWHEFSGKLIATLVASHEKGLTATDQLRTIAHQCYAWTLPYGVKFTEGSDVKDAKVCTDTLKKRLDMFCRDIRVYGQLIAEQRRADLACRDNCFMAKHRT